MRMERWADDEEDEEVVETATAQQTLQAPMQRPVAENSRPAPQKLFTMLIGNLPREVEASAILKVLDEFQITTPLLVDRGEGADGTNVWSINLTSEMDMLSAIRTTDGVPFRGLTLWSKAAPEAPAHQQQQHSFGGGSRGGGYDGPRGDSRGGGGRGGGYRQAPEDYGMMGCRGGGGGGESSVVHLHTVPTIPISSLQEGVGAGEELDEEEDVEEEEVFMEEEGEVILRMNGSLKLGAGHRHIPVSSRPILQMPPQPGATVGGPLPLDRSLSPPSPPVTPPLLQLDPSSTSFPEALPTTAASHRLWERLQQLGRRLHCRHHHRMGQRVGLPPPVLLLLLPPPSLSPT